MIEKKDEIIVCRNCGNEFTFTVGEQKFFEEKGFTKPVRCKECRNKRKAEKEEKTEEQKRNDFEDLLAKFKANTVMIEK